MTTKHTFNDFQGGYNPLKGIYVSKVILDADFSKDINGIEQGWTNMYADPKLQTNVKGSGKFTVVSFKSRDGNNETMDSPPEPEIPENFQYTPAYYSSDKIKKAIDWFKCDKTRVRIFRQLPGKNLELHHDFDNEKQGFDPDMTMVRILMPLTDSDSYLNLANSDSDVMIKLVKGQFAIVNVDTVWHGSVSYDEEPRDMLNIIAKWNDWLDTMTRPKPIVKLERITL